MLHDLVAFLCVLELWFLIQPDQIPQDTGVYLLLLVREFGEVTINKCVKQDSVDIDLPCFS
jgi:hypothetical protein